MGTLRAVGMYPEAYSEGSRTSIRMREGEGEEERS